MKLRDDELLEVMLAAKRVNMTCMFHAENGDIINWLTDKLEEKGLLGKQHVYTDFSIDLTELLSSDPVYHAWSRPPAVEAEATNRAITLSELVDHPILFVHVSSAEAAKTIRKAQTRGVPCFAETCPQYLYLSWQDLVGLSHSLLCEGTDLMPSGTLSRPFLLREQQACLQSTSRARRHGPDGDMERPAEWYFYDLFL
jgi:dihydroorotase-like cyclic amidohydrolase